MNSEKIEKSLKQWKLPRSSPSDVFKRRGIFKFCPDPTLQTVEKEIPLSEGNASFPLFTNDVQRVYQSQYSFLHIGMIQVALKPTKLGLNTSAIICLRDKRFLKFDQSVMAMVESDLSDGPIYFSYFPTHCVALCDRHSAFTIDVNSQGEGEVILMYRFHYKVMCEACPDKKNLLRSLVDRRGETTLFVINVSQSGSNIRAASKKIYWDEVPVPEKWMDDSNPSSSAGAGEEGEMVRMDWKEAAGAYALKVDVPGFKIEEVEVEAKAGRELVISGENEEENGKFLRRLRLPEDAKMDEVKAAMENGVLTVTLPERWMDEPSLAAGEHGEVARIDWKEEAEAYTLKVHLPGFKQEEVRVEMEAGRVLLISGERRLNEDEEESGKWRCIERSSGKFLRRLKLPENAKMDEVKAAMENGMVTVVVPKEEVK